MMSDVEHFSCTYWPSRCLLWKTVYSAPMPTFVGMCFCVSASTDLLFCLTCPALSVCLCDPTHFPLCVVSLPVYSRGYPSVFFFFLDCIYLFDRERQREREHKEEEKQREREKQTPH